MTYVIISALYLVGAIVALWIATIMLSERSKLHSCLPLMILSFGFCIIAAIFFYDLLLTLWHLIFTIIYATVLLWLLVEFILSQDNTA